MPENTSQPAVQSYFVTRISSLPTIATAFGTATNAYSKIKGSNGLVSYTLSTAENLASFAAGKTVPVLDKFSKQIGYVDGLACKGLDRVEESYPVIKKSPEEIINNALLYGQSKYTNLKDYSFQKIQTAKDLGNGVVHPVQTITSAYSKYSTVILASTNEVLNVTETYLDHYVPPLVEEEASDTKQKELPLRDRVESLSKKARVRVSQHAASKLLDMHKYGVESLSKLQLSVQLLQQMKDRVTSSDQLKDVLHRLHLDASWLQELLKDDTPDVQKTVPQRVLLVAAKASKQFSDALASASPVIGTFQSRIQEAYSQVVKQASELTLRISAATRADQLSGNLLSSVQEMVGKLQSSFMDLSSAILDRFRFIAFLPLFGKYASQQSLEMKDFSTSSDSSSDDSSSDS